MFHRAYFIFDASALLFVASALTSHPVSLTSDASAHTSHAVSLTSGASALTSHAVSSASDVFALTSHAVSSASDASAPSPDLSAQVRCMHPDFKELKPKLK
ncbi:MAG: hypothetical protein ACHQNT_02525 [Bacteroidia bacterium]